MSLKMFFFFFIIIIIIIIIFITCMYSEKCTQGKIIIQENEDSRL